ncbi:MAG: hypothetical protein J6I54_04105 [Bacteroidaceae bacterium]|nr:hypothetical protein [Bacteroidaceae bacterium]MBR1468252.1 hypothetical protein [Bacteroidaceae bacterium]
MKENEKEKETLDVEKKVVRRRSRQAETDDELALRQLRDAWRQISIDGQWFKRQIWLFVVIVAGIIVYITNRYGAQQEIIEEQTLREELQDWKFKSLTRNSELTFCTRQSQIELRLKSLGDSTIRVSNKAPYHIFTPNK